jgi:alanine racemase
MKNSTDGPDNADASPYIEINLDNVVHNLNQIRSFLPPDVGIMAVVKDNAYGCGGKMISRILEEYGVAFFAVAKAVEAKALKEAGIKSPVLVLGPATAEEMQWGSLENVRFALSDIADISTWKKLGCPVCFHAEIDTGMGRQGILPDEVQLLKNELIDAENLVMEGVFTHLANSDSVDTDATARQLAVFRKAVSELSMRNMNRLVVHYGNSAGVILYPVEECTMVRPGIVLYGCRPDPMRDFPIDLKSVMSLKAHVIKTKKVCAGTPISYGSTYITASDTIIATIEIGYGQGLPRILGNKGNILVGGKKYKIAGRVTMDYIMIDAGSGSSVKPGDEAVIMGRQGTLEITPDDIAIQCNTIGYEILCSVHSGLMRRYIRDNKIVCIEPPVAF